MELFAVKVISHFLYSGIIIVNTIVSLFKAKISGILANSFQK